MEINTSELSGAALDWAAAEAIGKTVSMTLCFAEGPVRRSGIVPFDDAANRPWRPSTDWWQGGPLIEWNMVTIEWAAVKRGDWHAYIREDEDHPGFYGPAPLTAAMQAIVAYKLGDTVSVPDELEG